MFGSSFAFTMGGTDATQGLASQGVASPEQAGRRRVEDKQSCLPVTARLVRDAAAQDASSGELRIHGSEVNMVVLVGVVEGLVKQSASVEFTLNDASGRVAVRHYVTGDSVGGFEAIQEGRYLSVTGNIRTSPAIHLSALRMRAVATADEVSYHLVEAAHAALKLRRASAQRPDPATPAPALHVEGLAPAAPRSEPLTPEKVAPAANATAATTGAAALPVACAPQGAAVDLGRRVAEVLRREGEGREEGVGLAALLLQLAPAAEEDVRQVLAQLVDAGEIYTTIDDAHFACL